jgi:hypothetical protein
MIHLFTSCTSDMGRHNLGFKRLIDLLQVLLRLALLGEGTNKLMIFVLKRRLLRLHD